MKAEILNIGTELLIGQVVNTNATYLAQELAGLGVDLYYVTSVGDNPGRIQAALELAWSRADLVICTGGLGPTADDLTHEVIAAFVGDRMELRPDILSRIEKAFAEKGRKLLPSEHKLAVFPSTAALIRNPAGTAAGVYLVRGDKRLMTFPGVPHELSQMWETWARPELEKLVHGSIRSRLMKFVGIDEADAANRVGDLIGGQNPTVAPYAGNGEVHLRVTAKADTATEADALLEPVVAEIRRRLEEWYFGSDDETLPGVVGKMLRERGATLAVAESCTGGLLASRVTDVGGSSDYFLGGVISYAVSEKVRFLGIDPAFIETHTHVSAEVTTAMAEGIHRITGATYGVGVTGYAGPSANTPEEEVGHVFVALSGPQGTEVRSFHFGRHPREKVKWFASQRALAMLFQSLKSAVAAG
ncbi:MAG TPA: competence/damage-inducible protein A [Pantanalinema sp.]